MIIEQLITQVSMKEFETSFFLKTPYSEPCSATKLTPLGSLQVFERLFQTPGIDLICGSSDGSKLAPEVAFKREFSNLLDEGYTIGFRHAEQFDHDLRQLAEAFRQDFLCEIDIHLYCTPANRPGFGWHYDAEDVFIIQTYGSKEWSLRKNSVNPWPLMETLPQNMRYEREIMPLYRCNLQAGDWLYIPHGYWHKTECKETSLSLSIGLNSPSGLTVYDFMRNQLLESLQWRQRLPTVLGKDSSTLELELRDHVAVLSKDLQKLLSEPMFVERYLMARKDHLNPDQK